MPALRPRTLPRHATFVNPLTLLPPSIAAQPTSCPVGGMNTVTTVPMEVDSDELSNTRLRVRELEKMLGEMTAQYHGKKALISSLQWVCLMILIMNHQDRIKITTELAQTTHRYRMLLEKEKLVQRALIRELISLTDEKVRHDVDEVIQGRSSISVRELDSQLHWHRAYRKKQIPKRGNKNAKLWRWWKAAREYRAELEERLHATSNNGLRGHSSIGSDDAHVMDIDNAM